MANNKIYSDYLMHYRTKGSRNGYSKDPNYTPIGQKAMTDATEHLRRRRAEEAAERARKYHALKTTVVQGLDSVGYHTRQKANDPLIRRKTGRMEDDGARKGQKIASIYQNESLENRALINKYADPAKYENSFISGAYTRYSHTDDKNRRWYENKVDSQANSARNNERVADWKRSQERNSRSDIGNALADAKEDISASAEKAKKKMDRLVRKGKGKVRKFLKKFR